MARISLLVSCGSDWQLVSEHGISFDFPVGLFCGVRISLLKNMRIWNIEGNDWMTKGNQNSEGCWWFPYLKIKKIPQSVSCFLIDMKFTSKFFGILSMKNVSPSDPHLRSSWIYIKLYSLYIKNKNGAYTFQAISNIFKLSESQIWQIICFKRGFHIFLYFLKHFGNS